MDKHTYCVIMAGGIGIRGDMFIGEGHKPPIQAQAIPRHPRHRQVVYTHDVRAFRKTGSG